MDVSLIKLIKLIKWSTVELSGIKVNQTNVLGHLDKWNYTVEVNTS